MALLRWLEFQTPWMDCIILTYFCRVACREAIWWRGLVFRMVGTQKITYTRGSQWHQRNNCNERQGIKLFLRTSVVSRHSTFHPKGRWSCRRTHVTGTLIKIGHERQESRRLTRRVSAATWYGYVNSSSPPEVIYWRKTDLSYTEYKFINWR